MGGPRSLEAARKHIVIAAAEHEQELWDRKEAARALCGKPVALLHVPGRLKGFPYVKWLLRWWAELKSSGAGGEINALPIGLLGNPPVSC